MRSFGTIKELGVAVLAFTLFFVVNNVLLPYGLGFTGLRAGEITWIVGLLLTYGAVRWGIQAMTGGNNNSDGGPNDDAN
ncbi:MAG: hypothetical protein HOH04_01410 [Rhodospirillaceae bacterium]|jgi:hypothetical protein|nr:hypothetical protein [Rhodospirillaceae bacterium]